jgi:hypothetical protein
VPALTFGVSTNFALAKFLASRSFGNFSATLAWFRFPGGSSNETYHVPLDLFAMGDAFPRLRAARTDVRTLGSATRFLDRELIDKG